MNIKHLIKPVALLAIVCGAPAHAQLLGGNAGGGLGGSLGSTLGSGMGSIGGAGQGNATGAITSGIDRNDELRRHTTGAVERTRETTRRARDRASSPATTVGGAADQKPKPHAKANGGGSGSLTSSLGAPKPESATQPAEPRNLGSQIEASANANGDTSVSTQQPQ